MLRRIEATSKKPFFITVKLCFKAQLNSFLQLLFYEYKKIINYILIFILSSFIL